MTIRPSLKPHRSRADAEPPRPALRQRIAHFFLSGLLLAASIGTTPVAWAAPGDLQATQVRVNARALFSGWVDDGRWTQIVAEVSHESGPGGEIVLTADPGQVAATVELAPGASKRVALLMQVGRATSANVSVWLPDSRVQIQSPIPLILQDTAGRSLAVIVAEGDVDLQGVDGLGGGQAAATALERPADLPEEPLAYASVDHLVLAGLGWEALRAGQREAILQWVGLGGHLLFTGGPSAARTLGQMPQALRPASVLSTRGVTELDALAALGGDGPPRGAATIAELVPEPDATVLLSLADGSPLAVQGRYGDGRVTVLAMDPFQAPLRGWGGLGGFWRSLARDFPLADTAWSSPTLGLDGLGPLLISAQGLRQPSLGWLLGSLALYILLAGPVNHRLLRRRRRLDLAWLTIPMLSLAATLVIYGLGRRLHGDDLRLDELSLVRAVPEAGVAHVTTIVSLFSPSSHSYELTAEHGAFRPAAGAGNGAIQVWQERQSRLTGLDIDQWSQRQVVLEAVIPWPQAALGHLTLSGSQVRADQPNPLGQRLEDAQLLVPGGSAWLGDVGEGDPLRATLDYEAFSGASLLHSTQTASTDGMMGDDGEDARRWVLLQAFRATTGVSGALLGRSRAGIDPAALALPSFRRPDALLIGWDRKPRLQVSVKGGDADDTRSDLAMVHTRLPIDLGGETPRFINGVATTRGTGSAERCGSGAALLSPDEPTAEFSFPLGLGRPQSGRIWLSLIGPANESLEAPGFPFGADAFPVQISLWDQTQGSWLTFNVLSVGQSAEIPRVISRQDGRDQIRLRLEANLSGPDERERWSMFDGCVEPRVAIQEGVAPRVSADAFATPTSEADTESDMPNRAAGSATPPAIILMTPSTTGPQP
ncbi:MAG: hypothetical protein IPL60_07050 [Ardenticatenia bacterium]|nr:hypothetical protein [Ardenticatenia bacterium]